MQHLQKQGVGDQLLITRNHDGDFGRSDKSCLEVKRSSTGHGTRVSSYERPVTRSMTRRARRLFVGWLAFADTPVTALALLKFQQGLEQSRAVEIRPEGFCDENLRIRNLPQQKIAHAHLAAGTDQK